MKKKLIIEVQIPQLVLHQVENGRVAKTQILECQHNHLMYSQQDQEELKQLVTKHLNKHTYQKVYWIIQQEHTIRKEVRFTGLTQKDLKQVLKHEGYQYLHLQEKSALNYQIIQEDPITRTIDVLLTALPNEVVSFYQSLSKDMGIRGYKVIEKCDVIACALSKSKGAASQLIIDLDTFMLVMIKGKLCLSQDSISQETIPLEILKRIHFYGYDNDQKSPFSIRLLSQTEVDYESLQQLQELAHEEIYPVLYTPKLLLQAVEKYQAHSIHNHYLPSFRLLETKTFIHCLVLFNVLICMLNVLLNQEIKALEYTSNTLATQQAHQQTSNTSTLQKETWINISLLDTVLNHTVSPIRLLHISWSHEHLLWEIEGEGDACLDYIIKMQALLPEIIIQEKYSESERHLYTLKLNR